MKTPLRSMLLLAALAGTTVFGQTAPVAPALPPVVISDTESNLSKVDASTNLFDLGALSIEAGPVYRNTSGESFEASTAVSDYLWRVKGIDIGARGEVITGNTDNVLHQIVAGPLFRKPLGNVAIYVMLDAGRDMHAGAWVGEFGAGTEYAWSKKYATGSSARYTWSQNSKESGYIALVYVSRRF